MRRLIPMLLLSVSLAVGETIRQPEQPATGPGGAEYRHRSMRASLHGDGGKAFWIYEPAEPAAKNAPVVIFLHGYSAMDPIVYEGWIEHIARRGAVVIYPRYQENLRELPGDYYPNTAAAVRSALEILKGRVDLNRVAVVGHSAGGIVAVRYAAGAQEDGLPKPKAAVIVEPGQGPKNGFVALPLPSFQNIPADMKLVVAVGDSDAIAGDSSARRIWRDAEGIKDRLFVTVQSDQHGTPALRAGHLSPLAVNHAAADAHDWNGWWRIFDTACDAGFRGKPLQLSPEMGTWSDGHPLAPLKIERPTQANQP